MTKTTRGIKQQERMYESIWKQLKAVDVGIPVAVKIHASASRRLIQAVKKEKTIETAQKKKLGMRFAGKMDIDICACEVTDKDFKTHVIVKFTLTWDGQRL